mmetsp:Transcript_4049/g.7538  ORF Transcript_4049/g.7538 Transcript_4049/m.7538 type:complete len:217 (-) Transcript_4049:315-965(-)
MIEVQRGVGNCSMHDAKGILPQGLGGTLAEEDVNAGFALSPCAVRGGRGSLASPGASGSGGSNGHGLRRARGVGRATMSIDLIFFVNAAVIEDVLERIVVAGSFASGLLALAIVVVAIIVVREARRSRGGRSRRYGKTAPRSRSAVPSLWIVSSHSASFVLTGEIDARQSLAEGANYIVFLHPTSVVRIIHHDDSSGTVVVIAVGCPCIRRCCCWT